MSLAFNIRPDQEIELRQTFDAPTVYLDHWAIRLFSDDISLQDRFVNALHNAKGTLLLSHQNLAEFTGPDDMSHAVQAELFLNRILPNVFFALSAFTTLEREALKINDRNLRPPDDCEFLKCFAMNRPEGVNPLSFNGILTAISDSRDRLGERFRESNKSIADIVNKQRQDPNYRRRATSSKALRDMSRMQVIMDELLRNIVIDQQAPFTDHDTVDYQHAILSTSYCDFALLDRRWHDMVERMERRLAKLDFEVKHAHCFSRRNNGLEAFLLALEMFSES